MKKILSAASSSSVFGQITQKVPLPPFLGGGGLKCRDLRNPFLGIVSFHVSPLRAQPHEAHSEKGEEEGNSQGVFLSFFPGEAERERKLSLFFYFIMSLLCSGIAVLFFYFFFSLCSPACPRWAGPESSLQ